MIDARTEPLQFLQALTRFTQLACDAARVYGLKVEHILSGGKLKNQKVVLARMDLLQAIDREFKLSYPQLAILFRFRHHTTVMLMRQRMKELPQEWRLPLA